MKLLTRVMDDRTDFYTGYAMLDGIFTMSERTPVWKIEFRFWWEELVYHPAMRFQCWRKGHNWIDDSHAGPDSGCMSMRCSKCGKSFSTWLY